MSSSQRRTHMIYVYILQCHQQNQLPPTIREISEACQIPLGATFRHVEWLETRGYIYRDTTPRSIRPLKPLLTDEELVYGCLVRHVKDTAVAPSVMHLKQMSGLSLARVKEALNMLEDEGRIRSEQDNRRLFYPVDGNQKSEQIYEQTFHF